MLGFIHGSKRGPQMPVLADNKEHPGCGGRAVGGAGTHFFQKSSELQQGCVLTARPGHTEPLTPCCTSVGLTERGGTRLSVHIACLQLPSWSSVLH